MPSEVLQHSFSFLESIAARKGLSYIALTSLVWESIITFPDEYDRIWKVELRLTKSLYLFIRYFALTAQIVNHFLNMHFLSMPYIRQCHCRSWFGFQSMSVQLLYNALEIVLMMRVYALYDRSFTTGILLMTLFIAEFGVMTVVWALVIRSFQFGPTCLLVKTPWMIGFMNTVVLVIQAIVWGMTAWKSSNYGGKGGKGICLVRIAHRDGAAAWIAMTVFFAVVTPYTYLVKVLTHSMFSLVMTLISFVGGRIILNIQDAQNIEEIPEFELSTVFSEDSTQENFH